MILRVLNNACQSKKKSSQYTADAISNNDSSHFIALPYHCFSTQSSTQLRHLYRGTSFYIPCWYQSVTYIISHRVTNISTSPSSLNLWPPITLLQSYELMSIEIWVSRIGVAEDVKSFGIWSRVVRRADNDVSKHRSAFTFKIKQS